MQEYHWYEVVPGGSPLAQGDFVFDCPILVPLEEPQHGEPEAIVREVRYDVVVMSHSCDLEHEKLKLVLVCPALRFHDLERQGNYVASSQGREELRKGYLPGYHLLNACRVEGFELPSIVVEFRSVFAVGFEFLRGLAHRRGDRLRLCPPYREHLSQAFARFFMRVGLPVEIEGF